MDKKVCEQEKKEYDACLLRFHNLNPGLCKPEKIFYEVCVGFEKLKTQPSKVESTTQSENARTMGELVSHTLSPTR